MKDENYLFYLASEQIYNKMIRTITVIKSIIDGLLMYSVYYLWSAFFFWLGIYLINIYPVTYLQCLGFIIVIRHLVTIFKYPINKHIK